MRVQLLSARRSAQMGINMKPNSYYAAILTLYNKQLAIDWEQMKEYIRFLISKNVKGFFPCGTSGEYISHTMEENLRLLKLVMEESEDTDTIIPCASTSNLYSTVELIHRMQDMGIKAVSVCPPYYIPLSQNDIYDYYVEILRQTEVELYLYNIPAFTNEIAFDTFCSLLSHLRVAGIKDSSGNMKTISRYIAMKEKTRPEFMVMTGTDEIILPALSAGCYGSVSALSGIIPEVHNKLYEVYREDPVYAQEIQVKITDLAMTCEKIIFPVGYKLALEARGFLQENYRQNVCEKKDLHKFRSLKEEIGQKVVDLLRFVEK